MVSFLKNSVCSILIGLLVFATMPFTASKHYCQNKLKSVAFLSGADGCCEENTTVTKNGFNERPCCHSENINLQTVKSSIKTVDLSGKKSLTKPIKNNGLYTALNIIFLRNTAQNYLLKKTTPPLPLQNFQALFQVYRI